MVTLEKVRSYSVSILNIRLRVEGGVCVLEVRGQVC